MAYLIQINIMEEDTRWEHGQTWMDMIGSRNQTSHTYNETTADEIFGKIILEYYPAFEAFLQIMEEKEKEKE